MSKTAFSAQNRPVQAIPQPKPDPKSTGFDKDRWDLALNFETVKTFVKFSAPYSYLVTKKEIEEALQAANEIFRDPQCDQAQKLEISYLLFHEFAKISVCTEDEEVRMLAEKARDSISYPFGPKYGQIRPKP